MGTVAQARWKLSTIIEVDMKTRKPTDPVHPGGILLEDFMKPAGVPPSRIHAIVNETRGITADTALRLGRFFSTTSKLWMNLQTDFDLRNATNESRNEIERLVHPLNAA